MPGSTQLPIVCLAVALAIGFDTRAPAQEPGVDPVVFTIRGALTAEGLGGSLALLDDLDKDGVKEIAATRRIKADPDTLGHIDIFSGKTRAVLRTIIGTRRYGALGRSGMMQLPDLNGDSVPELFAAMGTYGFAVLSLADGTTWYEVRTYVESGVSRGPNKNVLVIEDLDGDGIRDFLGSAFGVNKPDGPKNAGVIAAYSTRTGALLWESWGLREDSYLGFGLAAASDWDQDGVTDILVDEGDITRIEPAWRERWGEVVLLSGRTGERLRRFEPPSATHFGFGSTMVPLGDWDQNGYPEIAVAAPHYREDGRLFPDGDRADDDGRHVGWVGVYRLPEWELRHEQLGRDGNVFAFNGEELGHSLAAPGDLDRDGVPDLLIGTDRYDNDSLTDRRLYALSGATGKVPLTYTGTNGEEVDFYSVVPFQDLDGDGAPEFLVGLPNVRVRDADGNTAIGAGEIVCLRYVDRGPVYLRGDANGDGRVNVGDAVTVARYHLGLPVPLGDGRLEREPGCLAAFDVDGDDFASFEDARRIIQYLFQTTAIHPHLSPAAPYPECGRYVEVKDTFSLPCMFHPGCAE